MDQYTIYPKQFRKNEFTTENNRCFVMMPFNTKFDSVYAAIKRSLSRMNLICMRDDEIPGTNPIMNRTISEMLKARFLIADLTDYNPNVFYELGIAHSFKDANNILLIKENDTTIPVDLLHLTYIEYERDNLFYLTSKISEFIEANKNIVEFHEALIRKGIINFLSTVEDNFIAYIQAKLGNHVDTIIHILNRENENYNDETFEKILLNYEKIILDTIKDKREDLYTGIFKLYYELILSLSPYAMTEVFATNFLNGSLLEKSDLSSNEIEMYRTQFSITLAKQKKMLNIVMPWIISYFSRSKSTTIDLNRYSLESFLMSTPYLEIDKMISDALLSSNPYIREHISDIIGEKRIRLAKTNLEIQLRVEKNYYTAASMMEAIGKINSHDSLIVIEEWLQNNKKDIINTKSYFVLNHARIAIEKLDKKDDKIHLKSFDTEYKKYIKDKYIL